MSEKAEGRGLGEGDDEKEGGIHIRVRVCGGALAHDECLSLSYLFSFLFYYSESVTDVDDASSV